MRAVQPSLRTRLRWRLQELRDVDDAKAIAGAIRTVTRQVTDSRLVTVTRQVTAVATTTVVSVKTETLPITVTVTVP
jgi:hypothetical protein